MQAAVSKTSKNIANTSKQHKFTLTWCAVTGRYHICSNKQLLNYYRHQRVYAAKRNLFHDQLWPPIFHCTVCSVISSHNIIPAKRDVLSLVTDQTVTLDCAITILQSVGHSHY